MEFDNKLLLIISIAYLIFTNSFRGFNFSPTSSQENEIEDELKDTFGPIFDEAKEALSPDTSLDLDKVEEAFSPSLDKAKDAFGPISSWDEAKEAFGPVSSSIVNDAKKALSPSTADEAKETFGPASSMVIDKAKKELDSIASWISQNKEDISFEAQNEFDLIPSPTVNKAKKTISSRNNEAREAPIPSLPLASYEVLNKDKQQLGSSDSFITQKKEQKAYDSSNDASAPISSSTLDETKETIRLTSNDAPAPISSSTLDETKETIRLASNDASAPISSSTLDETKETIRLASNDASAPITSSTLDETKETIRLASNDASAPITSSSLDETKETIRLTSNDAPAPISSSTLDETKETIRLASNDASAPISSLTLDETKETIRLTSNDAPAPISSSTLDETKETIRLTSSTPLDESKENVSSHTSLVSQNKGEVSSDSPSILVESAKDLGPSSSMDENAPSSSLSPTPVPISPSTIDKAKHVIGSYSSKAIDAAKEEFGSISSFFSQNKVELTSKFNIHHPHSLALYFDQDTALAIESLIMKGQSNSHLAMEETKKVLSDVTVASSESGKCMQKCMKSYESCIRSLTKAMEDLNGRNADLLVDDISAVDGEIYGCQKCFLDNRETQSPLKDLEDAIIKAAHECLNILDHSD